MDRKIGIAVAAVLFAAIVGLGFYELILADKEGPTIYISDVGTITYTEGEDTTPLLIGVTAMDGNDGDVTASVIVSRITKNGEVYYAAEDKHGNVTESNTFRKINYIGKTKEEETTTEAPVDAPAEESSTESSSQEETTVSADGIPVIKLTAGETTINVGQGFNPLNFVESTYDDSGDVSRRIRAEGAYDVNKPGDYVINYSVSDPQGNQSEIVPFTLHVKEQETTAPQQTPEAQEPASQEQTPQQ